MALAMAAEKWPDVADISDRTDVFCVSRDQLLSVSRCGMSTVRKDTMTSCAMWPGTSAAHRGRIYIQNDVDAAKGSLHEISHLRPKTWKDPSGCQEHEASCGWDKAGFDELSAAIDAVRGDTT